MTTANKGLNQPGYNTYLNTWGTGPLNDNFGFIDLALGGSTLLNATGAGGTTVNLTQAQCLPLTIAISGTTGGIVTYTVPAGVGGQWVVRNNTSDGYDVRFQSAAGGGYVAISAGTNLQISCDGTSTGMVRNSTALITAAGYPTQVQLNVGGLLSASANLSFDGTTLATTGINVAGNMVLGAGAGSTLTLNSNAMTLGAGALNIGANTLYLNSSTKQVGIGTTTVGSNALTVAGAIASTAGGFVFPDSTTQTTAFSAASNLTFSGAIGFTQITETYAAPAISSGTLTINLANGTVFNVANNANITTFSITNAVASKAAAFTLCLTANGTVYTQAWGAAVKWPGGVAPTLTTAAGKIDVITFVTVDGGTTWLGFLGGQSF
jgi:hypothetical protein